MWMRYTPLNQINQIRIKRLYNLGKRESPQEALSVWENTSLGFVEAAHQWL